MIFRVKSTTAEYSDTQHTVNSERSSTNGPICTLFVNDNLKIGNDATLKHAPTWDIIINRVLEQRIFSYAEN